MQPNLFKVLGGIAGLAGISLGAFLLLNDRVLQLGIFSTLSQSQAFAIIFALLVFTFGISGIGVVGWLLTKTVPHGRPLPSSVGYILATQFVLVVIAAVYVGVHAAPPTPLPPPPPQPPGKTSFKLCFGEGESGPDCRPGADIKYGCGTYRGWTQSGWDGLASDLCGSKDKMTKVQTLNASGGGCGWTAFNLTCTK